MPQNLTKALLIIFSVCAVKLRLEISTIELRTVSNLRCYVDYSAQGPERNGTPKPREEWEGE